MSPQQEIEMILACQLASYLVMPIFVVDPEGILVFYNEPAEPILGRRFDETGAMPMHEWSTIFEPTDDAGVPIAPHELALAIALAEQRPAHRAFWIRGLDNVHRHIEAPCVPLMGQAQRFLGALAIFWEGGGGCTSHSGGRAGLWLRQAPRQTVPRLPLH